MPTVYYYMYYMVLPGFSGCRRRVAASQVYVDALLARRRPALDSHFLLSRLLGATLQSAPWHAARA